MNTMPWIEIIYWGATIIGGTMFILRTLLMLFAGGLDQGDIETAVGDASQLDSDLGDDHTGTTADSDFSFKLLSTQGLTAFFMMFGLVGLALLKANLPVLLTILGAGFAGFFSVWVISLIFSQMRRFQSDGNLNIQNAVGQGGTIYLSIPAGGTGQVRVAVQGSLKVFDAVSGPDQSLKTGEKIRVTGFVDHRTLVVEKI